VLLLIAIGMVAICVLGLVCRWILKARSGLDAMYQSDPDRATRIKADAQANVIHSHGAQGNSFGGGGV
jgi:hypothetical protein